MSKEKVSRNREIVKKRKMKWSFRKIADYFNLDLKTVFRVWKRDKEKYLVGTYPQKKS